MKLAWLSASLVFALAGPAAAQSMPGMDMGTPTPTPAPPEHDMASMPGMAMPPTTAAPAPDGAMDHAMTGTALPAGDGTAPAPPTDRAADRYYGAEAIAAAKTALQREHGGQTLSMIQFNLAELQVRNGRDGYRWDGEGWFGGDIDRFVVKSEGRGDLGGRLDEAEVQALYSRAIGPYFNLQAGVRQDIRPQPART